METRVLAALCAAVLAGASHPTAYAAPPPAAPAHPPAAAHGPAADNLVAVSSTQLRRVFVAPGADFRRFNKIILEPTEVVFADNWVRDFNRGRTGSRRLNDQDAGRIKNEVSASMGRAFTRAFGDGGYQIVTTAGPDVLRVHTKVANLSVTAPDLRSPGRSRTFSETAGEATLILEVRDSRTNALLGRALDRRVAGSARMALRNSVTNRADMDRVARLWAHASVEDLSALKEASPHPGGPPARH